MFVGSLSKKACWQMLHFGKLEEWGSVFVGCSGAFRIESVLSGAIKTCRIFSNDVSFLSCAIGHAALGRPFRAQYSGELAFLSPYGGTDALHAIAAAGVALEYASTSANNEYGIINTALAVKVMAKLALERFAELEMEDGANS